MNNSECCSSFFLKMAYTEMNLFLSLIKYMNLGAFFSTDAEWDLWLWLNIGWLLFKTISGYVDGISNILCKINLHWLQTIWLPVGLVWAYSPSYRRGSVKVALDIAQLWRQRAVSLGKIRSSAFTFVSFSNFHPKRFFWFVLQYSYCHLGVSECIITEWVVATLCYFHWKHISWMPGQ